MTDLAECSVQRLIHFAVIHLLPDSPPCAVNWPREQHFYLPPPPAVNGIACGRLTRDTGFSAPIGPV